MNPLTTTEPTNAARQPAGEPASASARLTMVLDSGRAVPGVALQYPARRPAGRRSPTPSSGTTSSEIARGLIALGIEAATAWRSSARPRPTGRWPTAASSCAGAVVAPIYHTNSPEECAYVLGHSEARAGVLRGRRAGREDRGGPRPLPRASSMSCCSTGASRARSRSTSCAAAGRGAARRGRRAPRRDRARGPGDAGLHVGDDRAAQGLHAHPRNFLSRPRDVRRPARHQRHALRCTSSCRWPTCWRASPRRS